ncbi:MAG: outer membrane beta-barrel protein [Gammaproteobacteria bacterium]|nr:outer membrane beta-barrel protein [Gammaproteobacteria bacterium]
MRQIWKTFTAIALIALIALPVQAHEQGDWIFRAGVGTVDPKSTAFSDPVDDVAVKVDSGTSLTLTGVYMINSNWAFEVLAAWPFKHDIDLVSGGVSVNLAETEHLPPTFSIQYHFMPEGKFQPYAGLGLNYTVFLDTDLSQAALDAGLVDIDLDNSVGVAAQIGADIVTSGPWLFNFDLRWINIESDATLDDGISLETAKVEIDPFVYSINVGYRF